MKTVIITDIDAAKDIWNQLSPKEYMYDLWEYRYAFYTHYPQALHFITIYEGDEPVGLLPLQYDAPAKRLEFFAKYYDFNRAFVKKGYEHLRHELYAQVKKNAFLEYVMKEDAEGAGFSELEVEYYLPLTDFASVNEYIDKNWEGKPRRKLKNEMRRINKDYEVEFTIGENKNIEQLFELNIKTFGDESGFFTKPYRKGGFRSLLESGLDVQILTLRLNGKIESVGMTIIYNDYLYDINSGTNKEIPNLGKMMFFKKMELALEKKCKIYEASTYEGNWKERFKFHTEMRYQYKFPYNAEYEQT